MVPTTATSQSHPSGPSSVIPAPPLPRPPPPPSGPGSGPGSGHMGQHHQQQSMGAPYGHINHRPQQHSHGMGPGGPSFPPMPPHSPNTRGPSGMPPSSNHPSGSTPSPYHHSIHSPASQPRQPPQHHPQHQQMPPHHHQHHQSMHPSQQSHHAFIPPHQQQQPSLQQYPHRSHHQQQQQQHPAQGGSLHQQQVSHASSSASSQQPPPPPPSYPSAGLNGDWQSDKDIQHRRQMIQHIVRLLKQKDKNASQEWLNKLPQMVKQLEVSLYRSAPSFEAYADTATLKHRLQLLAMEIARKTQQAKGERDEPRRSDLSPQGQQQQQLQNMNGMLPPQHPGMPRQASHGSQSPYLGRPSPPSTQMPSPQLPVQPSRDAHQQILPSRQLQIPDGQMQRGSVSAGDRSQVVRMDEINPMMGGNTGIPASPPSGHSGSSGRMITGASASNPSSSQISGNRNDPDYHTRIRHKQQRLLLLHHSSKCQAEDNRCNVTPHCADMKRLWKHMARCTDTNCRVSHCFSSRSILSHYRKCKEVQCPVCGPVRETVRKSQNKNASSGLSPRTLQHQTAQPTQHRFSDSTVRSSAVGSSGGMVSLMDPSEMVFSATNIPPQSMTMMPSSSPDLMVPSSNSLTAATPGGNFSSQRQPPSQPGISTHSGAPYGPTGIPYRPISSNGTLSSNLQHTSVTQPIFRPDQQSPTPPPISALGGHLQTETPSSSQSRSLLNGIASNNRDDPEFQSRIRHKQQRLLLLRHASKCTANDGECKVTPHCSQMKRLWRHISDCRDQQCKVQHCMSSRYVLSHYRQCKDLKCPACAPVRETIRKSQEKEKTKKLQEQQHHEQLGERMSSFDQPMRIDSSSQPLSVDSSTQQPIHPLSSSSTASRPQDSVPNDEKSLDSQMSHQPQPKRARAEHEGPSAPLTASKSLAPAPQSTSSSSSTRLLSSVPILQSETNVASATTSEPEPSSAPISCNQASAPAALKSLVSTVVTPKPIDETSYSLMNSFTIEQIETHITSLNRTVQLSPAKLKSRCGEILRGLQTHQHGWVFASPVDPVELGLPDYFDLIKKPMDLGTIQKKLESGSYHSIEDFGSDVRLTFDNAMFYNETGSVVHSMAEELQTKFSTDYDKFVEQLTKEEEDRRKNERACSLCGCEKLLYEPPVFFCNGLNCPSQRIRRNSHYYMGGSGPYYWCNPCYNELDDKTPVDVVDGTVKKNELKKKKNDEVHEESWVQCDSCERWIHQICGLFNARQNKDQKSKYSCPQCLLDKLKSGNLNPQPNAPTAEDLPRTRLSEWLERHVRGKFTDRAQELLEEKSEAEANKMINNGGPITVRQVTSTDRKLEVRERMKRRYSDKNYPSEFPYRCKCILVFQNLDGVDVILFALYLYEHGEDNPRPNQRTVYISYLDSVHFMRPRKLRTFVYHEILIAYLDYARQRGFSTAHIWACPPLKGDDYIFYAKPEDQKTPKDNRLRQWYIDMLVESQKRDIVGKLTNMYDLYFADGKLDATAVPYLEGDYFAGEAENVIKDLEEGRGGKGNSSNKKNKKKKNSSNGANGNGSKSKTKSKPCRGGARSTGSDEEDPESSVIGDISDSKALKDSESDPVMVKLGETIQPMKESFIVAFLNWKGAREEDLVVSQEITDAREKLRIEKLNAVTVVSSSCASRKRDSDGSAKVVNFDSTTCREMTDRNGNPIKIIDDDYEELDCEFLNNRQAFLNLCRGNHYQFDELRRAKHTSMMVLWHLHNRDAAKFVQQCATCSKEILSGTRYHCPTCADFDLCEECFKNPETNRGVCTHTLEPIAVEGENKQGTTGGQLSEAQRKERQRNIQLHIQLIEHASRCNTLTCSSSNCAKMKQYLKHGATCQMKASGGCKICKRIWTLLRIHAQHCKNSVCPIPQCMAIRERLRQLAKQQQAMDDRRRQEMNRHYGMGADSR